jgi:hypothetical protein
MALTHKPTLTKPTEGRTIAASGDLYRFLTMGEDTNGKYALGGGCASGRRATPTRPQQRGGRLLRARR